MRFVPFAQMKELCDVTRPVQVYRHTVKKCWSVRQDGIVVFRTVHLSLRDIKFHVSQSGRKRVIAERSKNVHAWLVGTLISHTEINDSTDENAGVYVRYNPYIDDSFVLSQSDTIKLASAEYATLLIDPEVTSDCEVIIWGGISKVS